MTRLVVQDLAFADRAPWRFDFEGLVHATPAEVWAAFVDNESWTSWFKNCKRCVATSEPFGGIGSTRHISVNGLVVDEQFIGWEPERLWAFSAVRMRLSFARSMVERARFTQLDDGRTRIDYRMAIDPHRWATPIRSVLRSQATKSFTQSFEQLDRHLANRRAAAAAG